VKNSKKYLDLIIFDDDDDNDLVKNCLIGIKHTKHEGNFLIRITDPMLELTKHIIYILSLSFNKILLFNTIGVFSQKYLICIGRKWDIVEYHKQLSSIVGAKLNKLPDNYLKWLSLNNSSIIFQNNKLLSVDNYYFEKLLAIWSLPSYNITKNNK